MPSKKKIFFKGMVRISTALCRSTSCGINLTINLLCDRVWSKYHLKCLSPLKDPLMLICGLWQSCFVQCFFQLFYQSFEQKKLYRESVKQDLDGLSWNLVEWLVTIFGRPQVTNRAWQLILLRLDRYEKRKSCPHIFLLIMNCLK